MDRRNGTLQSLLEPLVDPLYYMALDMTGNAADAEDVAQEAFLKATRGFGTFDPGRSFKAWMFGILSNTVIDFYRKRKRSFSMLKDEAEAPVVPAGDLPTAIGKLDPDQRMAVILVDLHDFSMKDAADMMGCPMGTVASRLSRGRDTLRRTIKT